MDDKACVIRDKKSQQRFLTGSFDGSGASFYVDIAVCSNPYSIASPAPPVATAMLGGTVDTQPIEVWHLRLGHLIERAIRQLITRSTGISIGTPTPLTLNMKCEPCLRGFQHQHISYHRGNLATRLLEHVWADIKGPLLANDVHSFRYFVIFVDEKSRFVSVFPLLDKADGFSAFKLFVARMERVVGSPLLNLHVDMGGEWISNEMRAHCRNTGVEILYTAGYAPNMNSIPERAIGTIIEHASALLWAALLPVGFWVCAVKTSVYLLNRSPHFALPDSMTPFEAWNARKPNLGHLCVFGCRAAAHIPDDLRNKSLQTSKSTPDCVFIGYSDTENLFELLDVHQKAIIKKRDVIFWEHQLGHPLLTPLALPHGVSIYTGVSGAMIPAIGTTDKGVPSDLDNTLPLTPIPGRQSVSCLPAEPSPDFVWENVTQEDMANLDRVSKERRNIRTLPRAELGAAVMMESPPVEVPGQDIRQCSDNLSFTDQDAVPLISPSHKDIPNSYKEAMAHPFASEWKKAMNKQLQSLHDNETWELVTAPPGHRILPNKWVFSYISGAKLENDLCKARLVARGDLQRAGIDYKETYAPVVKLVSLHVLLTWAKLKGLSVEHWDIVSAFLHGDIDDVEVYMKQPEGFEDGTGRVCHLRKALYGLCQAARQFYRKLDDILTRVGYKRLSADWAIWIAPDGGFIACHVDDMAAAGTTDHLSRIKDEIRQHLELKDLGELRRYLNINITNTPLVYYLDQSDYIAKVLVEFRMVDAHEVPTPMLEDDRKRWDESLSLFLDDTEKKRYQATVGCILYIMHATRPDLAYTIIRLSQFASCPRLIHWEAVKRVMKYIKGTRCHALALGNVSGLPGFQSDVNLPSSPSTNTLLIVTGLLI